VLHDAESRSSASGTSRNNSTIFVAPTASTPAGRTRTGAISRSPTTS
jgi:hypothetical protein